MADSDTSGAPTPGVMASLRRWFPRPPRAWREFSRSVSRMMPKGLYTRSLIIVIAPVILLQSVLAFVFMERHWQLVTRRLSAAVVRDISAIIDLTETFPSDANKSEIARISQQRLGLKIDLLPPEPLLAPGPKPFFSILDGILSNQIASQIKRPYWIDTVGASNIIEIRIQLDDSILRVFARRNQAYASNTHIFLVWMVGTSLVLLTIAILFLRNQIRPILQLAEAAESFGKGRPMPERFQPRGASEVRRAGLAFIQMRERIERQIDQRTAMLTGVSHDLRTILTRFKLQLALAGPKADTKAMNQDIDDMQSMLEGYLSFARGEAAEDSGSLDMDALLDRFREEAALRSKQLKVAFVGDPTVHVRPHAFTRLLSNLVSNAFRYADSISITATHRKGVLNVIVDDDGPGIPAERREDVFKPFLRLDEARNQDASGTGLGLSIARDIARSHGGDIILDDSPLGGLRAIVRLPA